MNRPTNPPPSIPGLAESDAASSQGLSGRGELCFLNLAVNRLALADYTVFVRKNCVPAFLLRHIPRQQIETLAIRMHI
jgi:hypothetical protein